MADRINIRDPYRSLPSLSAMKTADLSAKVAEKRERLGKPIVSFAGQEQSNLLDVAQADFYRAGGSLADFGRETANRLFGTEFDASRETGYSNQELADIAAGVSPELRQQGQAEQQAVLEAVSRGEYGQAALDAVKAAPFTLASSAGILPELIGGVALTAATGGVGGLAFGAKKIADIAEVGGKIKEAYEGVSKLRKAGETVVKGAKAGAKTAGQVSIAVADLTQGQIQEYEEIHGEAPSNARVGAILAGNFATMMIEGSLIKQLFIPEFKKEIVKEGANLVKNMGKGSNLVNLGKRVVKAGEKVLAASGAEAAQEYAQTWQEILSTNISAEEADNLMDAIRSQLIDEGNQAQAITGGLLGGAAGGTARAAIATPSLAVGTAIDATKATAKGAAKVATGTAKAAGRVSQAAASKASLKVLSQEERDIIKEEYNTRKTIVDQKTAELQGKIDNITKATVAEDIDQDVLKDIFANENFDQESIEDPKKFKALKDELTRTYKADQTLLKTELEASNIGRVASTVSKKVVDKTVKTTKAAIEAVPVDQVLETVKGQSARVVDAVKALRSSTALGIVELATKEGANKSKEIIEAARTLDVHDAERVAAALSKSQPKIARAIKKLAIKKLKAQRDFGQRTDRLTKEGNIPAPITGIVAAGSILKEQAAPVAKALSDVINGTIGDLKTLDSVRDAMNIYKKSKAFIEQSDGALGEQTMKALETKLDLMSKELEKPESTVSKVVKAAKDVGKKVGEKAEAAVKKVESLGKKKLEGRIAVAFDGFEKGLSSSAGRKNVLDNTAGMVKLLQKEGFVTAEDLADFFDQYPGLAADKEINAKLQEAFPTNVVVTESTDNLTGDQSTLGEAGKLRDEIFPECKGK